MLCLGYENRETLYRRIDARVDKMLEQGLLPEAQAFYSRCQQAGSIPTAAQAIGYKELFPYFRGEVSLEEAVEAIKRESRRYAQPPGPLGGGGVPAGKMGRLERRQRL